MSTICVCGAGTMGSGIAQVSAAAGFDTILFDLNGDVLQRATSKLEKDLSTLVQKGKMTEEQKIQLQSKIIFTTSLTECRADIIIEAIIEKMEAKVSLFNNLAEINSRQTIFASNTSSLSIHAIAKNVAGPERMAGLHFFNPAPVMKLVEVVHTPDTDPAVLDRLVKLTKEMAKEPVVCTDSPGFIVNRVARPYYIESLRIAEEGRTSMEAIDRILESRGFRMGPFKLMDLIGNDINYAVSCSVFDQLGQPERLKPSYIQKERVDTGKLGRKSGEGYYKY